MVKARSPGSNQSALHCSCQDQSVVQVGRWFLAVKKPLYLRNPQFQSFVQAFPVVVDCQHRCNWLPLENAFAGVGDVGNRRTTRVCVGGCSKLCKRRGNHGITSRVDNRFAQRHKGGPLGGRGVFPWQTCRCSLNAGQLKLTSRTSTEAV